MKPTALILAGGKGQRFLPFRTSKALWPFMGKTTLTHTFEKLQKAGIEEIVIVGNPDNKAHIEALIHNVSSAKCIIQKEALGMADAIILASKAIGECPVIIVNVIDFFDDELLPKILTRVKNEDPEIVLAGIEAHTYQPTGYVAMKDGRVVSVVEKPAEDKRPSNIIKLVTDYYKDFKNLVATMEKESKTHGGKDDVYERSLNVLLSSQPASIEFASFWGKLKYPHFVLPVMGIFQKYHLSKYISPLAHVSPGAHIEGVVYIDDDARIEHGAIVKGPSYIGRGTIIGSHCLVRESFVEEHSTIGFGSEVARSFIGPDCQVHHSFVGDSVLEKAVNMSWGSVTANLRADRRSVMCKLPDNTKIQTSLDKLGAMIAEGAFIAVNASTMPGVCIGPNEFIPPGEIVK